MAPIMAEPELRLTAQHLIRLHGSEAQFNAILRSERARLDGDFIGYKIWKAIGSQVCALLRQA